MTTFGLNVLAQTVADRSRLRDWITRLHSRATLIMDDVSFARTLARENRRLLVIHIEGAGMVLERMTAYNTGLLSNPVTARVRSFVRHRQLPSVHSPIITTLVPGTVIQFDRVQAVQREGWTWLPLLDGGWVAAEAAGI